MHSNIGVHTVSDLHVFSLAGFHKCGLEEDAQLSFTTTRATTVAAVTAAGDNHHSQRHRQIAPAARVATATTAADVATTTATTTSTGAAADTVGRRGDSSDGSLQRVERGSWNIVRWWRPPDYSVQFGFADLGFGRGSLHPRRHLMGLSQILRSLADPVPDVSAQARAS